jgi:hypothetical protein
MRTGNDGFEDHDFGTLHLDASFISEALAE